MKYIKQFLIILLVSCIGELLNYFLPLPIPGSIYGMILLFLLLRCGLIRVKQIKEASDFLIDIMPMLFIPSAVGIMSQFNILKEMWWKIIIITVVSTIIVMAVAGIVVQCMMKGKKK